MQSNLLSQEEITKGLEKNPNREVLQRDLETSTEIMKYIAQGYKVDYKDGIARAIDPYTKESKTIGEISNLDTIRRDLVGETGDTSKIEYKIYNGIGVMLYNGQMIACGETAGMKDLPGDVVDNVSQKMGNMYFQATTNIIKTAEEVELETEITKSAMTKINLATVFWQTSHVEYKDKYGEIYDYDSLLNSIIGTGALNPEQSQLESMVITEYAKCTLALQMANIFNINLVELAAGDDVFYDTQSNNIPSKSTVIWSGQEGEKPNKLVAMFNGNNIEDITVSDFYKAYFEQLKDILPEDAKKQLDDISKSETRLIDYIFEIGSAENSRSIDPLVVDLNQNNQFTTGLQNGTHFDHENDGFKEKTAWAEKGDGFLVRDINKNGLVDNGQELFGDNTLLENGHKAPNGFAALAQFDGNRDGKIDINDEIFSELGMWIDANGDGVTQEGEIASFKDLDIKEINLGYSNKNSVDANGNVIVRESTIVKNDGTEIRLGEINFDTDSMDTIQSNPVKIPEIMKQTMPELLPSGEMTTLQQAMTVDQELKKLVDMYMDCEDPAKRKVLTTQILTKWAGCEGIVTNSRGPNVNAVHLGIIEKFYGKSFTGVNGSNPNNQAGPILERVFTNFLNDIELKLVVQTHLLPYVMCTVTKTNEESGVVTINYTPVVKMFEDAAQYNLQNAQNLLTNYVKYMKDANVFKEYFNIEDIREAFKNSSMESAIDVAFTDNIIYGTAACEYVLGTTMSDLIYAADGNDIIYGREGNDVIYGEQGNDEIYGDSGNDVIHGGIGADIINGGEGNDKINGGEGIDKLYGNNGNDILTGGKGSDILAGGSGNNSYIFQRWDGSDVIQGTPGSNDTLQLVDINSDDIALLADPENKNNLLITVLSSDDIITIENFFVGENSYKLGGIKFADGSILDSNGIKELLANNPIKIGGNIPNMMIGSNDPNLEDILMGGSFADFILGYNGDDKLFGWDGGDYINGSEGNDLLNGGKGDDALYGGTGNDLLIGGKGDDYIYGEYGNDTYIFNEGDAKDIISDYDMTENNQDGLEVRTSYDNLIFNKNGNDLKIEFGTTNDSITVQSWFLGDAFKIENIIANDGRKISSQQVELLIQTMAAFETESGMSWEQALEQNPQQVNSLISDIWLNQTA